MPSLADCIKRYVKVADRTDVTEALKEKQQGHLDDKLDGKEARIQAVKDAIAEIKEERADIVGQIKKATGIDIDAPVAAKTSNRGGSSRKAVGSNSAIETAPEVVPEVTGEVASQTEPIGEPNANKLGISTTTQQEGQETTATKTQPGEQADGQEREEGREGRRLLNDDPKTYDRFKQSVTQVLGKEKAGPVIALVDARAKSAGMTPQQYANSRQLQVVPDSKEIGTEQQRQSSNGAFDLATWTRERKAVIHAFKSANVSTLAHELAHLFRQDLALAKNSSMLKIAEEWAGVKDGQWIVAQEEKFARAFERYLRDGQAPTKGLAKVFAAFKQWLSEIYKVLKGSSINVTITPEIRQVFDALLTGGKVKDGTFTKGAAKVEKDAGTLNQGQSAEGAIRSVGGKVILDNPGGSWLENQIKKATREDRVDGLRHGSVTATVYKIELPVSMVRSLPGMQGEHRRLDRNISTEDRNRITEIADSIKRDGYNPKRAIFINVGHDGTALINEGNHRVRAAEQAGLKTVPVEINYFAGGEAHGPLSIDKVAKIVTGEPLFQSLSTRLPSSVKVTEDPLNEMLTLDYNILLSDQKTLEKNINALMATPNMRKLTGKGAKSINRQAEEFVNHVVNNLLFLHDHMDPEMRSRAKLWYDGGRKMIEAWAGRYGISEMQGAAAIAVLSPQNGWFANVSQAERIADMVFGLRDFKWTEEMSKEARRISVQEGLSKPMQAAEGKTLGELLGDPTVAAHWARVYDQTYNNRAYRVITPEGGAADYVRTAKGAESTMMWKSYSTIAKAISILTDGRAENVYYQLGARHKVRNFYNNLFAPNSDLGFTTIDTHAVAAALLRSLSANDIEVGQAFGSGGVGASSSNVTGMQGTYPLYLEAYRRAAEARGLLPRQMQSITWEAVRGLFEASKKGGLKQRSNDIWTSYKNGEITQEQAQQQIIDLAGGITPPSWSTVPYNDKITRTYEGPAQKAIDAAKNKGSVPENPQPRIFFEVAPDPNDVELTEAWNKLSDEAKQLISQEVAVKIVPDVLKEIGTTGDFSMQVGGYMGATNPSMTLTIARKELSVTAAKLLGYALSQDSMMVVSEQRILGTEPVGAVTIDLPDGYGLKEITALYDKLYELERDGERLVGGHTTADDQMIILNFSNVDTAELATIIDTHLDGKFPVGHGTIFSTFIDKEAYQYGSDQGDKNKGRSSLQGRGDNLRNEATRLLRESLDSKREILLQSRDAGRDQGVVEQGDLRSDRAPDVGRLPTRADGRVGLIHFSKREGLTGLDPKFHGTGISGAESRRKQNDPKNWVDRTYYAIERGGYRKEVGLGPHRYNASLEPSKLYDASTDPDGFLAKAKELRAKDPFVDTTSAYEREIKAAGYSGYYTDRMGLVAAVFDPIAPESSEYQPEAGILMQSAEYDQPAHDEGLIFQKRTAPPPKKTVTAYKLFEMRDGNLYPLFIGANDIVDVGQWLDAEIGNMVWTEKSFRENGKSYWKEVPKDRAPVNPQEAKALGYKIMVKGKGGKLFAPRPGWHLGEFPAAPHIGLKKKGAKDPTHRSPSQVWAEVEVSADKDWQAEANKRSRRYIKDDKKKGHKSGAIIPSTAEIRDELPINGYYRYKTNPNMEGDWIIAGSIKVNRILSDAEVEQINTKAGVKDLPRTKPLDLKAYGFDEDSVLFQSAWHGSPHRGIEKTGFSSEKIGTGEGAQAYGYGLYFAGSKDVAEWYRKRLSTPDRRTTENELKTSHPALYKELYDRMASMDFEVGWGHPDEAIPTILQSIIIERLHGRNDGTGNRHVREVVGADLYKKIEAVVGKSKGQLYKVELSPEEDEYLLWDKPLSEQSEKVKKNLEVWAEREREQSIAEMKGRLKSFPDTVPAGRIEKLQKMSTPQYFKEYMGDERGEDFYSSLIDEFDGDKKAASDYLHSLSIRGIKYLDGSSRSKGEGAYNYVIFNDKDVEVTDILYQAQQNPNSWEAPEPSRFDNKLYKGQDRLIDTKRVQEAIEKLVGLISEENNPYLAEELFHERSAKRLQDFLVSEVKPLLNELDKIDKDFTGFETYLHARHAPEANISLKERNPNERELKILKARARSEFESMAGRQEVKDYIAKEHELATALHDYAVGNADDSLVAVVKAEVKALEKHPVVQAYLKAREKNQHMAQVRPFVGDNTALSGMSTRAAKDYIANLTPEKRAKYEEMADGWDAIIAKTRDTLVEYELESQDTVDSWADAFEHYVPLHREDMDNGMGIGQGFSVKGSSTRSRVGSNRRVVDILAHIVEGREKAIVRGEKDIIARALYGLAAANPNPDWWTIEQPPTKRVFDPVTGLVVKKLDPLYKSRANAVAHRAINQNGEIEERAVLFNERNDRAMRMAAALKNLDKQQIGAFLNAASKVTRYFASINTQYNLVFGPVNATRDLGAALLHLTNTPLKGRQRQVAGRVAKVIGPLFRSIWAEHAGTPLNTNVARAWHEMQMEGGTTGFRDLYETAADRTEALKKAMMKGHQNAMGAAWQWAKSQVTMYNDVMENSTRLAVYMEAIDMGLSKKKAASLAKNITVNFNRKGEMAQQVGALYAFFNASMQGTYKMYETMKGPAGRKIIFGGLMLGAIQAVMLAAAGFKDDEPPEFVKERSIVVPIGGKKYLTIPMPLGFNVIPNISRVATEWALSGGRKTHERVTSILGSLAETFNPVGNAGWSVQSLTPTIIDPLVALGENQDWTGKAISKPAFNSLKPDPGWTRAKDTASTPGIWAARAINWMLGGSDYQASKIWSPTPDQIDYLIGQAAGGPGRETLKALQVGRSVATGEGLPVHKIPFVSRFYGDSGDVSGVSSKFYTNIRELNGHKLEVEGRKEDKGDVAGYMREHPEASLVKGSEAIYKDVSKLQKEKRTLLKEDAPKAQVKAIEKRIQAKMEQLNRQVEALQK